VDLPGYFRLLARYNRVANERLYAACAQLDDSEYRKQRPGSFGSIHALLNHILLGDRIWMSRFEGGGASTPPLGTVLFEQFDELRAARILEDQRIEEFFDNLERGFLAQTFRYINNKGKPYEETVPVAVPHFFNHQTHHRGQIHVMLAQTTVPPPSLDMHRILNP
jgi:uncharacterized damage-inducible protein DinB